VTLEKNRLDFPSTLLPYPINDETVSHAASAYNKGQVSASHESREKLFKTASAMTVDTFLPSVAWIDLLHPW